MYQPTQQDFSNAQAWNALIASSLFLAAMPPAPASLASFTPPKVYPKQGDTLAPGVVLADLKNGLVTIAALEQYWPGGLHAGVPTLAFLDPLSQGWATVDENTAVAVSSGLGFRTQVSAQVPTSGATADTPGFAPSNPPQWIPKSVNWSNSLLTYDDLTAHAIEAWKKAHS